MENSPAKRRQLSTLALDFFGSTVPPVFNYDQQEEKHYETCDQPLGPEFGSLRRRKTSACQAEFVSRLRSTLRPGIPSMLAWLFSARY
jgi:hypothetical protein